jgi:hypothetical protein
MRSQGSLGARPVRWQSAIFWAIPLAGLLPHPHYSGRNYLAIYELGADRLFRSMMTVNLQRLPSPAWHISAGSGS